MRINTKQSKTKLFTRATALLTFFIFIISDLGLAAPLAFNAKPFEQKIFSDFDIQIPEQLGSIKESFIPSNINPSEEQPFVIHIQDAHTNFEAQTNIYEILKHLQKNYGFSHVGLEAADTAIDPNLLNVYPDHSLNMSAGAYLLEEGLLSGAEYFALDKGDAVSVFGVEDREAYQQNVRDFRETFNLKPTADAFLKDMTSLLSLLKGRVITGDLKKLVDRKIAHENNKLDLLTYVRDLSHWAENFLSLDLRDAKNQRGYPGLIRILRLNETESQIDFKAAQKEVKQVVQVLKQFRLTNQPLADLLISELNQVAKIKSLTDLPANSLMAQHPRLFFELLFDFSIAAQCSLDAFTSFLSFSEFLVLKNEIKSLEVFSEIQKLENQMLTTLVETDDQQVIVDLMVSVELLKRIFTLEASRNDITQFEAYLSSLNNNYNQIPQSMLDQLVMLKNKLGLRKLVSIKSDLPQVASMIQLAHRFYQGARDRDVAFIDNLKTQMIKEGFNKSVLISGGFHTDGVTQLLEESNIPYVVVAPNIKTSFSREKYLELITGKKDVLDDLGLNTKAIDVSRIFSLSFLDTDLSDLQGGALLSAFINTYPDYVASRSFRANPEAALEDLNSYLVGLEVGGYLPKGISSVRALSTEKQGNSVLARFAITNGDTAYIYESWINTKTKQVQVKLESEKPAEELASASSLGYVNEMSLGESFFSQVKVEAFPNKMFVYGRYPTIIDDVVNHRVMRKFEGEEVDVYLTQWGHYFSVKDGKEIYFIKQQDNKKSDPEIRAFLQQLYPEQSYQELQVDSRFAFAVKAVSVYFEKDDKYGGGLWKVWVDRNYSGHKLDVSKKDPEFLVDAREVDGEKLDTPLSDLGLSDKLMILILTLHPFATTVADLFEYGLPLEEVSKYGTFDEVIELGRALTETTELKYRAGLEKSLIEVEALDVNEFLSDLRALGASLGEISSDDVARSRASAALREIGWFRDVFAGDLFDLPVDVLAQRITVKQGAQTGQLSIDEAIQSGANGIIAGHSEARGALGDTNKLINEQVRAAFEKEVKTIILAVGETLDEKMAGYSQETVKSQILKGLAGLSDEKISRVIIAYEPRWAIGGSGEGRAATPVDAEEMAKFIRNEVLPELIQGSSDEIKAGVRIQYGGSANASNAYDFLMQPNVDGLLVGGKSKTVADFKGIVDEALRAAEDKKSSRVLIIGGNQKTYPVADSPIDFMREFAKVDRNLVQIAFAPQTSRITEFAVAAIAASSLGSESETDTKDVQVSGETEPFSDLQLFMEDSAPMSSLIEKIKADPDLETEVRELAEKYTLYDEGKDTIAKSDKFSMPEFKALVRALDKKARFETVSAIADKLRLTDKGLFQKAFGEKELLELSDKEFDLRLMWVKLRGIQSDWYDAEISLEEIEGAPESLVKRLHRKPYLQKLVRMMAEAFTFTTEDSRAISVVSTRGNKFKFTGTRLDEKKLLEAQVYLEEHLGRIRTEILRYRGGKGENALENFVVSNKDERVTLITAHLLQDSHLIELAIEKGSSARNKATFSRWFRPDEGDFRIAYPLQSWVDKEDRKYRLLFYESELLQLSLALTAQKASASSLGEAAAIISEPSVDKQIPQFKDIPAGQLVFDENAKLIPLAVNFLTYYGGDKKAYQGIRKYAAILEGATFQVGETEDEYVDINVESQTVILNKDFMDFLYHTGRKKITMAWLTGIASQLAGENLSDDDRRNLERLITGNKRSLTTDGLTRLDDTKNVYEWHRSLKRNDEVDAPEISLRLNRDGLLLMISDLMHRGRLLEVNRISEILYDQYGFYATIPQQNIQAALESFYKEHTDKIERNEIEPKADLIEDLTKKLADGAKVDVDKDGEAEKQKEKVVKYSFNRAYMEDPAFRDRLTVWDVEVERQDEVNFGGKTAHTGEMMFTPEIVTLANFATGSQAFQGYLEYNTREVFVQNAETTITALKKMLEQNNELLELTGKELIHRAESGDKEATLFFAELNALRIVVEDDSDSSIKDEIEEIISTLNFVSGKLEKDYQGKGIKEYFTDIGNALDARIANVKSERDEIKRQIAHHKGKKSEFEKNIEAGKGSSQEFDFWRDEISKHKVDIEDLEKKASKNQQKYEELTLNNASLMLITARNLVVPQQLGTEIKKKLGLLAKRLNLSLDQLVLAIRSSAIGEDSEDASFAGRQDTYIFVTAYRPEQVAAINTNGLVTVDAGGLDSFINSWVFNQASLFNKRAIDYRLDLDLKTFDDQVEISTLFQEMFLSELSYIGFSIIRGVGFPAIAMDIHEGQGEKLVSGQESGSKFISSLDGEIIIVREKGDRKTKIVETEDGLGKVERRLAPQEADEFSTTDQFLVKDMAGSASRLDRFYESKIDTEGGTRRKRDAEGTPIALEGELDQRGFQRWDWGQATTQVRPETVESQKNRYVVKQRRVEVKDEDFKRLEKEGRVLDADFIAGTEGVAQGTVAWIFDKTNPEELAKAIGKILVTFQSDPDMDSAMKAAKGIIAKDGGPNSHTMIVASEFGLVAITGTKAPLLNLLKDGMEITIDANRKKVLLGMDVGLKIAGKDYHVINDIRDVRYGETRTSTIVASIQKALRQHPFRHIPGYKGVGLKRLEIDLAFIETYTDALLSYDNLILEEQDKTVDPAYVLDRQKDADLIKHIEEKIKGYNSAQDFYESVIRMGIRATTEPMIADYEDVRYRYQKIDNKVLRLAVKDVVDQIYKEGLGSKSNDLLAVLKIMLKGQKEGSREAKMIQEILGLLDKRLYIRLDDRKSDEYKATKGADKYVQEEHNPMKGYRGLGIMLDSPTLEWQLRVMIQEAMVNRSKIALFAPIVRRAKDFEHLIERFLKVGETLGLTPVQLANIIEIGMMTEIPNNAIYIEDYLEVVRKFREERGVPLRFFTSTGGNDLLQTVGRVDRNTNEPALKNNITAYSPAVIRANARIVAKVKEFNQRYLSEIEAALKNGDAAALRKALDNVASCGYCGNDPSVKGQDEYAKGLAALKYDTVSVVLGAFQKVANNLSEPDVRSLGKGAKERLALFEQEAGFDFEIDPEARPVAQEYEQINLRDVLLDLPIHPGILKDYDDGKLIVKETENYLLEVKEKLDHQIIGLEEAIISNSKPFKELRSKVLGLKEQLKELRYRVYNGGITRIDAEREKERMVRKYIEFIKDSSIEAKSAEEAHKAVEGFYAEYGEKDAELDNWEPYKKVKEAMDALLVKGGTELVDGYNQTVRAYYDGLSTEEDIYKATKVKMKPLEAEIAKLNKEYKEAKDNLLKVNYDLESIALAKKVRELVEEAGLDAAEIGVGMRYYHKLVKGGLMDRIMDVYSGQGTDQKRVVIGTDDAPTTEEISEVEAIELIDGERKVVKKAIKTGGLRGLLGGRRHESEEANPDFGFKGIVKSITRDREFFLAQLSVIKEIRDELFKDNKDRLALSMKLVRTYEDINEVQAFLKEAGLVKEIDVFLTPSTHGFRLALTALAEAGLVSFTKTEAFLKEEGRLDKIVKGLLAASTELTAEEIKSQKIYLTEEGLKLLGEDDLAQFVALSEEAIEDALVLLEQSKFTRQLTPAANQGSQTERDGVRLKAIRFLMRILKTSEEGKDSIVTKRFKLKRSEIIPALRQAGLLSDVKGDEDVSVGLDVQVTANYFELAEILEDARRVAFLSLPDVTEAASEMMTLEQNNANGDLISPEDIRYQTSKLIPILATAANKRGIPFTLPEAELAKTIFASESDEEEASAESLGGQISINNEFLNRLQVSLEDASDIDTTTYQALNMLFNVARRTGRSLKGYLGSERQALYSNIVNLIYSWDKAERSYVLHLNQSGLPSDTGESSLSSDASFLLVPDSFDSQLLDIRKVATEKLGMKRIPGKDVFGRKTQFAVSDSGEKVVGITENGRVKIWEEGKEGVRKFNIPVLGVQKSFVDFGGEQIIVQDKSGVVIVRTLEGKKKTSLTWEPTDSDFPVYFDAKHVITADQEGKEAVVWNLETRDIVKVLKKSSVVIDSSIAINPNGNLLVKWYKGSLLEFWDIKSNRLIKDLETNWNRIVKAQFISEGAEIAAYINRGGVLFWHAVIDPRFQAYEHDLFPNTRKYPENQASASSLGKVDLSTKEGIQSYLEKLPREVAGINHDLTVEGVIVASKKVAYETFRQDLPVEVVDYLETRLAELNTEVVEALQVFSDYTNQNAEGLLTLLLGALVPQLSVNVEVASDISVAGVALKMLNAGHIQFVIDDNPEVTKQIRDVVTKLGVEGMENRLIIVTPKLNTAESVRNLIKSIVTKGSFDVDGREVSLPELVDGLSEVINVSSPNRILAKHLVVLAQKQYLPDADLVNGMQVIGIEKRGMNPYQWNSAKLFSGAVAFKLAQVGSFDALPVDIKVSLARTPGQSNLIGFKDLVYTLMLQLSADKDKFEAYKRSA